MIIEKQRLDIDRVMSWVACGCGAAFWWCERHRAVRCPGCKAQTDLGPLEEEFKSKGGEVGK